MDELYKKITDLATAKKASDIFVEPDGADRQCYTIRIKTGNSVSLVEKIGYEMGEKLINFVKIKARIPNDGLGPKEGYFSDQKIAFRTTLLNGFFGQVLSLRTIHREPFEKIIAKDPDGKKMSMLEQFKEHIVDDNTLSIVCGRPSQGKTTTMFYLLKLLIRQRSLRVISYEEPVEFIIDEALQFSRNEFSGIDVKSIYKYLLRMSPDLIVIGEIRDSHDWSLVRQIFKSGIPVMTTMHCGGVRQARKLLEDNGFSDYNVLFQFLEKGQSPEISTYLSTGTDLKTRLSSSF